MSDDNPTTESTTPAQEAAPKPESFSLEYVQELRNQAAKYRTEKKEAAERAKAEVMQDYEARLAEKDQTVNSLQAELESTSITLRKLQAVLREGISSEDALEVASLVQGVDDDTISESVKRVKSLIGKAPEKERPVDPSQGSGNYLPLNGDPILETVKRMVGA